MSNVLSKEEIDELLHSITAEARRAGRKCRFFKKKDKVWPLIHENFENFARRTARSLSLKLRSLVHVHVASIDRGSFEEFIRSIPNPSTMAVIRMPPLGGYALFDIDPGITSSVIERLYGGRGAALNKTGELSDIELTVMEDIFSGMLGDLREAWEIITELQPYLERIETDPVFAEIVAPTEPVVFATLEMKVGEEEGLSTFCIPYRTIEAMLANAGKDQFDSNSRKLETLPRSAYPEIEQKVRAHAQQKPEQATAILEKLLQNNMHHSRQAAIVLAAVDKKSSIPIIQNFPEKMLSSLMLEIASLDSVTLPQKQEALTTYYNMMGVGIFGGIGYVRDLLQLSFESPKDDELMEQINDHLGDNPFGFINKMEQTHVVNLIQRENSQSIACILAHLEPKAASSLLERLPIEIQSDVTRRIATMGRPDPEVLRKVALVLKNKLAAGSAADYTAAGGVKCAVDILTSASRSAAKIIIESLEEGDPELAEEIKKRFFVFDDIIRLDDRAVQKVLQKADTNDLAKALKAVDSDVQNKVFSNMSERAATLLKEDMEFMGPVRLRDVEESQQNIVSIIRMLEDEGEIVVGVPMKADA